MTLPQEEPSLNDMMKMMIKLQTDQANLLKELTTYNKEQDVKQEKRDEEFKAWRDRQEERDRKQEERDRKQDKENERRDLESAKRDEEFKAWRDRQEERDRKQEERDRKQEERDKKQDVLNKQILNALVAFKTQGAQLSTPRHGTGVSYQAGEVPSTPTRSRTLSSAPSTARKSTQKIAEMNDTYYRTLAKAYKHNIHERSSLSDIFDIMGGSWRKAWDSAKQGITKPFHSSTVQSILTSYRGLSMGLDVTPSDSKPVAEDVYQKVFEALVIAIQAHLREGEQGDSECDGRPQLEWLDSHKRPFETVLGNRRKPDGAFRVQGSGEAAEWSSVLAVVEMKGSDATFMNGVLRGQLIRDLIDMAAMQPRRFRVGLTIAKVRDVHIWVSLQHKVYVAPVGRLPHPMEAEPGVNEAAVIKLLAFLYQQLPHDNGMLIPQPRGIPSPFKMADILGHARTNASLRYHNLSISLSPEKVCGRHRELLGPNSWIYTIASHDSTKWGTPAGLTPVFKFHWHYEDASEASVHKAALKLNVPYTPRLVYASSVHCSSFYSEDDKYDFTEPLYGEVMIIENAGVSIESAFEELDNDAACTMVDIFAGYVHSLFVAAMGDNDMYVLHRDISMNNLLVLGDSPRLIDWGCGRVFHMADRTPSSHSIVGTAVYMGIRILAGHTCRCVVDDLESLFLVLCHLLWRHYGRKDKNYASLWRGRKDTQHVILTRLAWLERHSSFLNYMQLSSTCPPMLKALAEGLYELLYPRDTTVHYLHQFEDDPRAKEFSAARWVEAFAKALAPSRARGLAPASDGKCLEELRHFVEMNPACGSPGVKGP
ncbi:hypothetical protein GGF46_005453 [Coemansia sp. RSA 552]|nr:hypothetical protein GGF46_005453 [Coemansia sp. RSA 552]